MKLYRQRPVVVEAEMWEGTFTSAVSIQNWCKSFAVLVRADEVTRLLIKTPSGEARVEPGGYVVHEADGSYRVLSAAEFGANFEPVLEL